MTKRRLVWAVVAVCLALAVGLSTRLATPRPCPVTLANCERIQNGMTLAEVEAVLGGWPGSYATGMVLAAAPGAMSQNVRYESWWTDEGHLLVQFDEEGRSCGWKFCGGVLLPQPSLLDRLRAWLGW